MADVFIYNLTTIGGIDPSNDWMIIEDTSTGETKKTAPGQLPISTATQTALDTKVDENAPIVAATKTKVTYDAKGLVTGGADLAASDLPTGIDAAKISGGSISNAEFDYLNGLSDNIQAQLNGKQQSLTLTTLGTGGPAVLAGGTLNIPQYSAGAAGVTQIVAGTNVTISPVGGTGVVTINATGGGGGGGGTVTSVAALTLGTGGTDLSSTVANSTTTPVITLNVPNASASNRGALTSTDWSTFNGKQDQITATTSADYYRGDKTFATLNKAAVGLGNVDNTSDANKPVSTAQQTALDAKQATLISGTNIKTINSTSLLGSGDIVIGGGSPSGVSGAIQFSNGSAFASDAANLFWDDTNNRLGVGTNAPSATAHFKGSGTTSGTSALLVQNSAGSERLKVTDNGVSTFTPASAYTVAITTGNNGIIRAGGGYENADGVYGSDGGLFLRATSNMYITANNGNTASFGLFGTGLGFNIGTGLSVDASAVLNLNSTTRGFLPPRMTTTQKTNISTPAAGLMVYDTTLAKLCVYTTAWETITSL